MSIVLKVAPEGVHTVDIKDLTPIFLQAIKDDIDNKLGWHEYHDVLIAEGFVTKAELPTPLVPRVKPLANRRLSTEELKELNKPDRGELTYVDIE